MVLTSSSCSLGIINNDSEQVPDHFGSRDIVKIPRRGLYVLIIELLKIPCYADFSCFTILLKEETIFDFIYDIYINSRLRLFLNFYPMTDKFSYFKYNFI